MHTGARIDSRRALTCVLLAVLVAVAAGVTGKARFSGPRWVPHLKIGRSAGHPQRLRAPPASRLTIPAAHGTGRFPLGAVLIWIIVGIVVVGIAALLWRWWAGRPTGRANEPHAAAVSVTTEVPVQAEPEADAPALRTGIELALEALDEQREPADAIVRAWLGLQETAENSGIVRRPAETPTEFTSRILSGAFADDWAVRTLLRLYLRTRFGDHPVTGDDVAAARGALEGLVRTWSTPDRRPAGAGEAR